MVRSGKLLALGVGLLGAAARAQSPPSSGSTTLVLDGNRAYAALLFVRPDGSTHEALAFVDMGSPSASVSETLYRQLGLDGGAPLTFRVGQMTVTVPGVNVSSDPRPPRALGPRLKVESVLPASVLRQYDVVIDYGRRTLTLGLPGTIHPTGVPVLFHLQSHTGLLAVDATVDGKRYPITIDNGSAYTWLRQSTAASWLTSHPDWKRGVGAVGVSNMMMSGDGAEASGILMRIPALNIGSLTLKHVGALAAGPGRGLDSSQTLFDWYSTKNALPVIGWIGGNVLKHYRLTIDYPGRSIYWLEESPPDTQDLDQVGITLRAAHGELFIAAVATKNGVPTVTGVFPGDRLVRVGDLDVAKASWGALYSALHGRPGETRTLAVERNGRLLTVPAKVTAF